MMTRRRFILTAAGLLVPALPSSVSGQGPFVARRLRDVKPPFGAVQINWGHTLARGLNALWLHNEAGGSRLFNLVAGVNNGLVTDAIWRVTRHGIGLFYDGAGSDRTSYGNNPTVLAPSTFSWTSMVSVTGGAIGTGQMLDAGIDSVNERFMRYSVSGGVPGGVFFVDGSTGNSQATTPSLETGLAFVVGTYDDAGDRIARMYLNGVVGTAGSALIGTLQGVSTLFAGATRNNVSVFNGTILFQSVYRRVLSPAEILELYAEPYAFLQPVPAVTYVFLRTPAAAEVPSAVPPLRSLMGVGR